MYITVGVKLYRLIGLNKGTTAKLAPKVVELPAEISQKQRRQGRKSSREATRLSRALMNPHQGHIQWCHGTATRRMGEFGIPQPGQPSI